MKPIRNRKLLASLAIFLTVLIAYGLFGDLIGYPLGDISFGNLRSDTESTEAGGDYSLIDEDGIYHSKDEVALYIQTYQRLPQNFLTKAQASELGWEGGALSEIRADYAIGGDVFKNREGLLPEKPGRVYYECDIDTNGESSRGAKRIVFSNDGLIYFTDDHYESFTKLFGEE